MVKGKKVITTIVNPKLVVRKLLTLSTRDLTKCIEQSGSKQVDKNKEIRLPILQGRKVAITTTDTKLKGKKLLTASIRVVLEKDGQDISMKKVWI